MQTHKSIQGTKMKINEMKMTDCKTNIKDKLTRLHRLERFFVGYHGVLIT